MKLGCYWKTASNVEYSVSTENHHSSPKIRQVLSNGSNRCNHVFHLNELPNNKCICLQAFINDGKQCNSHFNAMVSFISDLFNHTDTKLFSCKCFGSTTNSCSSKVRL